MSKTAFIYQDLVQYCHILSEGNFVDSPCMIIPLVKYGEHKIVEFSIISS